MEEQLYELATTQGILALLSIVLIFYVLKTQEKRDTRQEEKLINNRISYLQENPRRNKSK